jgi:Fe-S cluster assembly ATP-binding protein
MTDTLKIENLHVSVEGKPILRGVDLTINRGETHALMGPNGSGKSTLGLVIMGHPKYQIIDGKMTLNGEDLLAKSPDERARLGLFYAFQRPVAIPGVKLADFLRHATTNVRKPDRKEGEELLPMREFRKELRGKMEQLRMDPEFGRRYVNDGFSGGEMKRAEILQLAMLQPKFAILDETDSGLDIDALKAVGAGINSIMRAPAKSVLLITHYQRLLDYVTPDRVHVLSRGRIVRSGGPELAHELEREGYAEAAA